ALTDPAAVVRIAEREKASRPAGDKEIGRLRLGWALVRLGQLTDSAPLMIEATTEFYEAAVRHRDWPLAWFGLGAAKVALDGIGAREFRSAHQTAGNGWRLGAVLAFLEATRADPDYTEAAIELAKVALRDDKIVLLNGVGTAIERATALDGLDPLAWLLLGRYQRRVKHDEAAAYSYGRAVELGGATRGMASLELARQLIWLGRPDSARIWYFAGASEADPDGIAAYRKDIATIAPDSVLVQWDALSPASRPDWLRAFWRSREVESGRPEGTRLPEHEERWRVAYKSFRLIPAWTYQYQFGMPFRSGSDELDDRGIIYIRHGEPDQLINHFSGEGEEAAQTWLYFRPDGNLIFHFKQGSTNMAAKRAAVTGWRAVESIRAIGNLHVLPNLIEVDPIYMSLFLSTLTGSRVVDTLGGSWGRERLLVRESLARGTITDTDPLRFEHSLHPIVQVYGVGGESAGRGTLLVVLALPASDSLEARPLGDGGYGYVFRLRLTALDLALEVDTLLRLRVARPLTGDQLLGTLFRLDVPAGIHQVRAIISDSAATRGSARLIGDVPVPAFAGPLEMSDLVLGLEGQGLSWNRAGTRFPLNPRNAWTVQEAIEIGFELAGLSAGQSYKVRIGIADLGADSTRPPRAAVEFENQASGAREFITQSLNLRTLRPGRYLLTATIISGDSTIRRERRITVAAAR
ncbi:MAG: hypothetical protein ABIZ71_12085, partial [Gemmatimonadales bacterium]